MGIDGSNVEVLTPPEQNTIHPNWSTDSERVIYWTNDDLEPPKKNSAQINAVDRSLPSPEANRRISR